MSGSPCCHRWYYANKNSFVLNSLIVSLSFAAFSNSKRLADSRMSVPHFADMWPSEPLSPISWSSMSVGDGKYLYGGLLFPVDDCERKAPKDKSARGVLADRPTSGGPGDQIYRSINFLDKLLGRRCTAIQIPQRGGLQFIQRCRMDFQAFSGH